MHDGDIDTLRIEQQVEPSAAGADHHDVCIARELPTPALERHDNRALVSIVAREHPPTLAAQIFARRQPGPRRDLLRAATDRRGDDDSVSALDVCEDHLGAD